MNWFLRVQARLPHIERSKGRLTAWRVYGFKPYRRLCLFDYTRANFYAGNPPWVRVRVLGCSVFERNHHLSGLPGAH